MNSEVLIFDSVQKTKREFIPLEEGKVSLYVCGPTVYDDAHLGHAKSALVFDLLTRVLTANGYDVTYARNITDIDDKIIKKAIEQNKDIKEITDFYTEAFHNEMEAIGGVVNPNAEVLERLECDRSVTCDWLVKGAVLCGLLLGF